jgi:hypothetical protein
MPLTFSKACPDCGERTARRGGRHYVLGRFDWWSKRYCRWCGWRGTAIHLRRRRQRRHDADVDPVPAEPPPGRLRPDPDAPLAVQRAG